MSFTNRPMSIPRYRHGSRVPGWDDAVDLTKPPATVPVSAIAAATAWSDHRAALPSSRLPAAAPTAPRNTVRRLTAWRRRCAVHSSCCSTSGRSGRGLRDDGMPESYERCPDGWQSHHEQPVAPRRSLHAIFARLRHPKVDGYLLRLRSHAGPARRERSVVYHRRAAQQGYRNRAHRVRLKVGRKAGGGSSAGRPSARHRGA